MRRVEECNRHTVFSIVFINLHPTFANRRPVRIAEVEIEYEARPTVEWPTSGRGGHL